MTSTGKPSFAAASRFAPSSSETGEDGSTGTPAFSAASRARILSPIASIASGVGPTNVSPASSTLRAKPAFSARKP